MLSDLPQLIDPDQARSLAAAEIEQIASEPSEARAERARQEQQRVVIEDVLRTCLRYTRDVTGT